MENLFQSLASLSTIWFSYGGSEPLRMRIILTEREGQERDGKYCTPTGWKADRPDSRYHIFFTKNQNNNNMINNPSNNSYPLIQQVGGLAYHGTAVYM